MKLLLQIVFTILCGVFNVEALFGFNTKVRFDVLKMAPCKQYRNLTMIPTKFVKHEVDKEHRSFNLNMMVKKEISSGFYVTFSLMKCDSMGNPDSCEIFMKDMPLKAICKNLGKKDEVWSDFIGSIKPPIAGCPIKPNTYKFENVPLTEMKRLPFPDGFFKAISYGYDQGLMITCTEVFVTFTTVPA